MISLSFQRVSFFLKMNDLSQGFTLNMGDDFEGILAKNSFFLLDIGFTPSMVWLSFGFIYLGSIWMWFGCMCLRFSIIFLKVV